MTVAELNRPEPWRRDLQGFYNWAYIDNYPVMAKSRKINCVRNNEEDTQGLQTELFIHRPYGRIRDRNSYWNDPFPPLGKQPTIT